MCICCCCQVTSVVPDSVRPHRRQPTRLPRPWNSPGKNTGVGCHFLLQCMKVKSESEVAQSCPTLATPWTAAYQAPPWDFPGQSTEWGAIAFPKRCTFRSSQINVCPHMYCFSKPRILPTLVKLDSWHSSYHYITVFWINEYALP